MRNEVVSINVPSAGLTLRSLDGGELRNVCLCDLHYHNEVELLAITEGSIDLMINNKRYPAHKGDVVFCSSRIPHATYINDSCCQYTLLQFRPEHYLGDSNNTGKYFNRFVRNAVVPFMIIKNPLLFDLISEALDEYQKQDTAFELFIKGTIYSIIALLCREGALSAQNSAYSADIEKILPSLAYIEEHCAEDITLEDVAAVQNLTPSYFCRIFKRASGSNFIDYLNFVRICKSEKLLADGNSSILEISYDVGFSSVSYFNRIFKKYKNCTPTEYRRAQYKSM